MRQGPCEQMWKVLTERHQTCIRRKERKKTVRFEMTLTTMSVQKDVKLSLGESKGALDTVMEGNNARKGVKQSQIDGKPQWDYVRAEKYDWVSPRRH